jgi:succinate-semialdehyde dehydrogenase/glutarate-semialdehyde dehydrogenase
MTTMHLEVTDWLLENVPQRLLINNLWVASELGREIDVLNPANESVIARVAEASPAQIDTALRSTSEAQIEWRKLSSWKRSGYLRAIAEIMRRDVELYARVMTYEQGKPLEQSKGEVLAAADQFDWNADEARRIYGRIVQAKNESDQIHIYRQPVGPVACFAPWNFPSLLPARKISAALAAGCVVIAMPAQESPLSCLLIGKAAIEAGLPPGVLNLLTGDPVLISQMLIDSEIIRKVSLTGSVPIGAITLARAAKSIKPVTVELGGHSAVIVLKDANVDEAAKLCAIGKFRNAGQVCISANRFFVHKSVSERFISQFVEHAKTIRLGQGIFEETDMGPLGSARRVDAIEEMITDAKSKGAQIALGGKRPDAHSVGFFFEPTVLLDVSSDMSVMKEETFGPIAPIKSFENVAEAISLANETPYGLAGFIFTTDLNAGIEIGLQLEVGMVGINNLTIASAEAPFGGVKASGFGREGGSEGIEDFLITKYVNARMKKELV